MCHPDDGVSAHIQPGAHRCSASSYMDMMPTASRWHTFRQGLRPHAADTLRSLPLGPAASHTPAHIASWAHSTMRTPRISQAGHLGHAAPSASQQTQAQVVPLETVMQDARHHLSCSRSCQRMQAFNVMVVWDTRDVQVHVLQRALSACGPAAIYILTAGIVPGSHRPHKMSATALPSN